MKKSKVFVSLLLAVMLAVSGTVIAGAENDTHYSGTTISGTISFDGNQNIDVTDLDIKVYSLVLSGTNEDSKQYDHVYETTVHPDNYGNFSAERPSEYTYFEIDENTIPEGYGVDKAAVLILENESNFSVCLSKISDFKVDFINETVDFYDSDENSLTVNPNYELECDTSTIKNAFLNNQSVKFSCEYENITVAAVQQTSNLSMTSRIDYLYKNNIIGEQEKVMLYANSLQNGIIQDECEAFGMNAYINSYAQKNEISSELRQEIKEMNREPTYGTDGSQEATYDSSSGYFRIHYMAGTMTTSNLALLCSKLEEAKYFFCDTTNPNSCNFTTPRICPQSNPASYVGHYNIFILDDGKRGETFANYNNYTFTYAYTTLRIKSEDYENGVLIDRVLGTACHEFMHAIQFEYNLLNPDSPYYSDMVCFCEAAANAAKIKMVPNCGLSQHVHRFLDSPNISIFTDYQDGTYSGRRYGAVLYPLSLIKDYYQFHTLRHIYEVHVSSRENPTNIYSDIDYVLQGNINTNNISYNSSFINSYLNCMLYDYKIKYFYTNDSTQTYYESDWDETAKLITVSEIPAGVTTTMHLGTRYYEITESDLSEYNSFSISMYNSTMINNLALQMVVTQNNTPTSATYQFSSPIRTVIFDLANADKNCFITSNISLNGSIAYTPRVFYQEVQP